MYIRSRIKYFFAQITPHNLVEFYMMLRMPKRAASFLDARFDKLAPFEVRRASGDYRQKKWDFMEATKYFLRECKPSSTVAIFNEWFKAGMPHTAKPNVIVNMMLTVPHMAFGMSEEEKKEKVDKIITLVAATNKPLLKSRFANGPLGASVAILQTKDPGFVPAFAPMMSFDIPERKLALLFILLEKVDADRVEFLKAKLPDGKAQSIGGLMNTIKIDMNKTQIELKETEGKLNPPDPKPDKKAESLTELMQTLSNFIDQFVESTEEPPEEEKSEEGAEA